ncbi:MAG: hypothetical protein OJJ54_08570 [Pseudonocardia sp.]|nr:hypothetical protein [Pseudonocardia sp.]
MLASTGPGRAASVLGVATALAATGSAVLTLIGHGSGPPRAVTTPRGEPALLQGTGVDAYDTVFTAAGHLAVAVVVLLVVPVLLDSLRAASWGSSRGALLAAGALGYLLHVAVSDVFGTAYGPRFLLHVVLLGLALPAFGLALAAVDRPGLEAAVRATGFPRRSLGGFLLAAGGVTTVTWSSPLVSAAVAGRPPAMLGPSTTMVTDALDLAVVVPAAVVGGILVLRRRAAGLLLAAPLLVLIVALVPTIALGAVLQARAGVVFTPVEIAGPVAGVAVLGALGLLLLVRLLRAVPSASPPWAGARPRGVDDV